MPKITVIVPVYKVEPYLRRCVDSILNQTFTDFELILVDDGSPDGCGAICDEYIDPRITVIHQPNGGLSAARNSGIDWAFACSDSEWLGFVDSDDWVHPQYLDFLYSIAYNTKVQISICEFSKVSNQESLQIYEKYSSSIIDGIEFYARERHATATVVWNKLYSRDIFLNHRYPVGRLHEDEFLTYKLLYEAGDIAFIENILYYYFDNSNGIMNTINPQKGIDLWDALWEQYFFLKTINKSNYFFRWVDSRTRDSVINQLRIYRKDRILKRIKRMLKIWKANSLDY